MKLESENPTGSVKDRMAQAVISRAEKDGRLKRYKPSIKIVAVEPAESLVLLGGPTGLHKITGVGIGYIPPLWEPTLADDILPVRTSDAKDRAKRVAREEALFAGTSSGGNFVAAIRVTERLGPDARVVTLMADSGL